MDGAPEKVQVSVRLPSDVYEALGKIADTLDRDRTWVMLRALNQYLAKEGADVLREAEGLAALDRGEGVDFDRVMEEVDDIIARAEAKPVARTRRR
jgi:predicted transcriptional regulator